jgi:hypothetical protein
LTPRTTGYIIIKKREVMRMDKQEKLKTLRLSADTVGELSDLVGRKKRAGKRATVKDEAERAIAKHLKGEWRKMGEQSC